MGTLSRGQTFGATESLTNTKLHNLVDLGSVTSIVNADIAPAAAIAYSKLSLTGSIVNADVDASAAIAYSKLNLSDKIVDDDIKSDAAIVDTKLDQIVTASKVHGSSITGLASVPSGAGVLPIANLATGTPDDTKFVRDDNTLQVPPDGSNVIFRWDGFMQTDAGDPNTALVSAANTTTNTGDAYQYITNNNAADTFLKSKWLKFAGVNTISFYARAWRSGTDRKITVNVGGQSASTADFTSTTPTWSSVTTIDVSSLSNGTLYDITISSTGAGVRMSNIVLFGS